MSRGRIHRKAPQQQMTAAHTRDKEMFRAFPERIEFRRKYTPGEFPTGDITEDGKPLAWVVASSPIPGGYIWLYCTESTQYQDIAIAYREGNTPILHALALAMFRRAVADDGQQVEEVFL